MKLIYLLLFISIPTIIVAQTIDTLSFFSKAFNEERTVYVHQPEFYDYKSASVKLPIIYLLDGQHEWFVNPLLSDIRYLQYTHEIPNAIVVVIPHKNRNKECGIVDLNTELPLDIFITEELDKALEKYHPNDFKLIVGHSFSASFSLYAYYNHSDYYTGVIANTPLDEMELIVDRYQMNPKIDKSKVSISIGGIAQHKDYYHRSKYNELKEKHPEFFQSISIFEADYAAHNAVPIVATPTLITRFFEKFSGRYAGIAKVNREYKLIDVPESTEKELQKIITASKIDRHFYPPEIAEINGLASRYWNSEFNDLTIEVYKLGIEYYPNYYDFYLSLYELTIKKDKVKAKEYLEKAATLLQTVESDWEGKEEVIQDIKAEKVKNGW